MESAPNIRTAFHDNADRRLVEAVKNAAERATGILGSIGLPDDILVKIRVLHDKECLAQYRSNTQFSGRPIFWMSDRLHEIVRQHVIENPDSWVSLEQVALDNLLHEYFHVIWEYGVKRRCEPLLDIFRGKFDGNEEMFAEECAMALANGGMTAPMRKAVDIYRREVFGNAETKP